MSTWADESGKLEELERKVREIREAWQARDSVRYRQARWGLKRLLKDALEPGHGN